MAKLIAPSFIGIGANQINYLIDKAMASGLPEGSVSSLNYANIINIISYGIIVSSIVMLNYSKISKEASMNNINGFISSLGSSITSINLFMWPLTLLTMIFSRDIVEILFNRGAFNSHDVIVTSNILIFLSIGMLFNGTRDILDRSFYALQETKKPIRIGVIGVAVNIILNLIFVTKIGVIGLALSTSISSTLCCILLIIFMDRKLEVENFYSLFMDSIKVIIASLIMATMIFFLNDLIAYYIYNQIILLISKLLIGMLIYCFLIVIFKVGEFSKIYRGLLLKLSVKVSSDKRD